ncbi:hypothetical protein T265_16246, partial [Opisthorchis viverrini]
VTVNQCADIVVARAQKRLQRKQARDQQPTKLYLVVVRWVKSKAYIVASGAEESGDRLEPQPGYACHVSTWSRIDPLDPAKVSLESAYQMSQLTNDGVLTSNQFSSVQRALVLSDDSVDFLSSDCIRYFLLRVNRDIFL